jgi:DNA-binding NtrC family response regulator
VTTAALPAPTAGAPGDSAPGAVPTLEQMERDHIARALRASDGHRGQAARMLGISERNLYRKLREHGLLS